MTVPAEYHEASRDFERYMAEFMRLSTLETHHRAYAVTRAVLHVFRSHLAPDDVMAFADVLPAVLRALFLEGWRPSAGWAPFPGADRLLEEIRGNRRDHNLADRSSKGGVARALRSSLSGPGLDAQAFERALAALPEPARDYWQA